MATEKKVAKKSTRRAPRRAKKVVHKNGLTDVLNILDQAGEHLNESIALREPSRRSLKRAFKTS
jgi:hypothetical protein